MPVEAACVQTFFCLTVKPPGAARYQNVTLSPSLHVWQERLDCLDGTEEIDLQDLPHWLQRLHLQRPHQTHASVAHCNTENTDVPIQARLFLRNYWAYLKCLFVSPQSSPSPPGWTSGWWHPSGVCPRCPCGDLWHFPKDVPFWTDFSLLHKLERKGRGTW